MTLLSDAEPVEAVLARPHGLLEAPRFGPGGEAIFSDVIAGGVWGCSVTGAVREILPKRRGVGGIVAHHADGGWVISGRSVIHLQPGGEQREILSGDGACGYNDLGVTAAGELRFRPMAGDDPQPGRLLKVGLDGAVWVLTEDVICPNGIGVSPDGQTIYLSDYARGSVLAVTAQGETREFWRSPRGSADGLAVDSDGGVWLALGEGGGIARFYPGGELDAVMNLPTGFLSSLCVGGDDMRDVLITTADNEIRPELGGTLLRARSRIAGLPVGPVTV